MKTEEVKFKRYTPSEGKALKIHRRLQNTNGSASEWLSYSMASVIIDDELIAPIEEVDAKEFQVWYEKESPGLGIGSLTM